jgi:hypothetical protein
MKLNFVAVALSILALLSQPTFQQDAASPYDDCRIVTSVDLADSKAPAFAAYSVPVSQVSGPPKLDLKSSPTARMYRTVLRREIAQGPNFAGHYRLAVWGCGSSCAMFAVVNLKTGRVIVPEGFSYTSGVHFSVDHQKTFPDSQSEYGLFGFRSDSELLVVLGDLDEDEKSEGAFYLVLRDEELRLIHTTRVKKDCEGLRHQPRGQNGKPL